LQFSLNEAVERANSLKFENQSLSKVIESLEKEKIENIAIVEQQKRQIELLEKARDHKEKHSALLI
jgi:hypothetical protein